MIFEMRLLGNYTTFQTILKSKLFMNKIAMPLLLLAVLMTTQASFAQSEKSVIDKIYNAIYSAKKVEYVMSSSERFNGKFINKNMFFRIYASPKKVYMKDKDTGVELLYVAGWNDGKAFINPNGFPWVNVSLDIFGARVRKDGHHTILHAGFGYVTTLLKYVERELASRGKALTDQVQVKGELTWNGRSCIRLVMSDPSFSYKQHTCTKSETLHDFAERNNLSEYMIMEKNGLQYGARLSSGQSITIPTAFAKEVVLYVDKENYLPIVQMIYDDKGLFEKYEFRDLKINPNTASNEWTTQCASYGFQ